MRQYRTFVIPYDYSEHARAALDVAVDLSRRLGADLNLVHVVQTPAYGWRPVGATPVPSSIDTSEQRKGAMASLSEVVAEIDIPGEVKPHVVEGTSITEALRDLAETLSADLIVMGTHGRTGLAHVFLGSVAERTLRVAPCPVLAVRAEEDGAC
jgi:nucleotide-binding universal stress UspA family protein